MGFLAPAFLLKESFLYKLNLNFNMKLENVVIVGSGCAGWTAALYVARANLNPLVITGLEEGGQLALTTIVENYPGFPEGIMGPELMEKFKEQAIKFGTRVIYKKVDSFKVKKGYFEIGMQKEKINAKAIIISTGASARLLGLDAEKKYMGKGVSTCATCDAYFYKDKIVVVIGGGDSACEESLFISKFAKQIYIIHRKDQLRASKIMQDRVFKNKKIKIIWDSEVKDILGDGKKVTGVKLKNIKTNKITEMKTDGFFLAIGHVPNSAVFKGILDMDENGFIKTDRYTRTNVKGVFAVGDVQDPIYKQAVTAAGSGCQGAMEAEKYLEGAEEKRRS